ncbi:MAG: kelch repeat-containing protein [Phycisphaeraceae bacterium]
MKPFLTLLLILLSQTVALAQSKSYRLPSVDLKQPIIWGSECEGPDGTGMAFGGSDQLSEDGIAHTRVKRNGKWDDIYPLLVKRHSLTTELAAVRALRDRIRDLEASVGYLWFEHPENEDLARPHRAASVADEWHHVDRSLGLANAKAIDARENQRIKIAEDRVLQARITNILDARIKLDEAASILEAEPTSRALSPIVYDAKAGLYVIFGGDHLDYLMNDVWAFDPKAQRWEPRFPKTAPPPRANHTLKANGDGTITLTGGYTYTSNTDYVGGQYRDINDGEWTYDLTKDTWTPREANAKAVEPFTRTYRTGPFHPNYYFEGEKPDRAAVAKTLEAIPANTWVSMKPPRLPRLNRDWGTATIDPDHDLILRFSGGHSAHGGSDVLHYHLATNRWELTFPVEFPLGQLYSNTEYPEGYNFNQRPWVSGHTYKNYTYDPLTQRMYFTGHRKHMYIYDPMKGDWVGRIEKPAGMTYNGCFYDLMLCPTPRGVMCWTKDGRLFVLKATDGEALKFSGIHRDVAWTELKLTGDKLRGSVVDRCGITYDSKRDRLVCFGKTSYGGKYDGVVYTIDLKSMTVKETTPPGAATMIALDFLRETVYDPKADMIILGATFALDGEGPRQTPAYDCAAERWISFPLVGTDPNGKEGRNVSLGLVYDARRSLIWAVDTNSHVYVLRFDRKNTVISELK